ncbi:hypothetical protein ZIOFF_065115 [Zingiber officinale]|uniref:Nudix hydrolase domain-containing protein n=1 Tax=Zingiber officinale TaxID=94328 RepID=A0A8J5EWZ5_ZINOF|nr:hypothetical protein ZIOFF_065115 [Zingiber officinale]
MASRQGRQLQRYSKSGRRLVVLIITSSKGNNNEFMFPKGGWETDETIKQAVSREAMEEAGVQGTIQGRIGTWVYKSRTHEAHYQAIMFPMKVTEELAHQWPEMHQRQRAWVSIAEAKERCRHWWMKEALDRMETDNVKIITWINNSVSHSIGAQLAKYETAKELALTESSELRAFPAYVTRREEQRLVQFLMALRDDFEGLRGTILYRSPLPSVDSVVHELLAEEIRLKSQVDKKTIASSTPSVFATPQRSMPHNQSRSTLKVSIDECAYCKEKGHWKSQCSLLLNKDMQCLTM